MGFGGESSGPPREGLRSCTSVMDLPGTRDHFGFQRCCIFQLRDWAQKVAAGLAAQQGAGEVVLSQLEALVWF